MKSQASYAVVFGALGVAVLLAAVPTRAQNQVLEWNQIAVRTSVTNAQKTPNASRRQIADPRRKETIP